MAFKFGNLIVGDNVVGAAEATPTTAAVEPTVAPVMKQQPIVRQTKQIDDTPLTDKKVSQYVEDMGVGNKINSLFD